MPSDGNGTIAGMGVPVSISASGSARLKPPGSAFATVPSWFRVVPP